MTKPETVADVMADLKTLVDSDALERVYDRLESALAASAEPVAWRWSYPGVAYSHTRSAAQIADSGRYFADGPEGSFYTDDLKLARRILDAYDENQDWTITDLPNPTFKFIGMTHENDPDVSPGTGEAMTCFTPSTRASSSIAAGASTNKIADVLAQMRKHKTEFLLIGDWATCVENALAEMSYVDSRLYLMTGDRDRYKMLYEHGQSLIVRLKRRIKELEAAASGPDGRKAMREALLAVRMSIRFKGLSSEQQALIETALATNQEGAAP